MTKYKEKHLMKVRVREDGTINGDSLFDERESIVNEQCSLFDNKLSDFSDVINIIDTKFFFEELKPLIHSLQKSLREKYVEKEVQVEQEKFDEDNMGDFSILNSSGNKKNLN